ncbi:hypothetical protein [Novosphingobium sp. KA1]|uniref:hypothetical protein n=1 Tax=Novosphingobium sp. (strain KA1) TaxID=164608 RepID=UPI001A8D6D5E|nr:hypothetical protein [Novosphingobium sp. KA1]
MTSLTTLSLMLAACGGGGGDVNSTPAPTPAPTPTYQTLDTLSGEQVLDAANVNVSRWAGNGSSSVIHTPGAGISITYSEKAGTYVLVAPEGYSVTLSEANRDTTLSNTMRKWYGSSSATATDVVIVNKASVNNVVLSYTMYGTWDHTVRADELIASRQNIFVSGIRTQKDDVPKVGAAQYQTMVAGTVLADGTTYVLTPSSDGLPGGTANFSVNFASGTVATALNLNSWSPQTGQARNFGSFSGTGTLEAGGSGFSGNLSGSTGAGAFAGALFGPKGVEMGYSWFANGTDYSASGVVVGRKR